MSIRISKYRLDMGDKPIKSVSQLNFDSSPSVNQTASGIILTLTVGVTMNFGDVGYIDPATANVLLVNATTISTSSAFVMCADPTITNGGSGQFLILGTARNDSWMWSAGALIYASTTGTTGNTITQSPPTATDSVTQILGVATNNTKVFFNPQLVQIEHA